MSKIRQKKIIRNFYQFSRNHQIFANFFLRRKKNFGQKNYISAILHTTGTKKVTKMLRYRKDAWQTCVAYYITIKIHFYLLKIILHKCHLHYCLNTGDLYNKKKNRLPISRSLFRRLIAPKNLRFFFALSIFSLSFKN